MPMKLLLDGYSGYATIDNINLLMTSFSLSLNENIIQSNGIGKIYHNLGQTSDIGQAFKNGWFERYKINAVRDFPGYDISISCDANFGVLNYFLSRINDGFHSFINVSFYDSASNIFYEFSKCFLTSFQLGVTNNSCATVSFGFVTFEDEIDISFGSNSPTMGRNAPVELVGAVLMPYWAWGAEYPDFADEDLYEFSISFSQQVTPKFGCQGRDSRKSRRLSKNAILPMKIIVGVPEVKYELTYIVATSTSTHDYDLRSNRVATSRRNLVIKFHQDTNGEDGLSTTALRLRMSDCYPDSYSPQYANSSDVNKISVSGTVYGRIEYFNGYGVEV